MDINISSLFILGIRSEAKKFHFKVKMRISTCFGLKLIEIS